MVLRTVFRMVAIGIGTLFLGLAGVVMGIGGFTGGAGDVDGLLVTVVVTRSVLVLALVVVMTWLFRVQDRKAANHATRPYQQVLLAAGLAYVVNISSWAGQTLFGQLLVPAGVSSAVFDFVVWMAVAVVGVRLGERARVQAKAAAIPYA
jgi:hypothetical protein